MELKGNLISVREDARVLDATLRDGGLVNDFFFTDEFVRSLYAANTAAGVDYMEFGYKASKALFDREKFGKWKFCDDEDIRAIVGENENGPKISVMADVGRCDYQAGHPSCGRESHRHGARGHLYRHHPGGHCHDRGRRQEGL